MSGLDVPLTPLRFLGRAAEVHPDKTAIVDGPRSWDYAQFARDTVRLADALRRTGVRPGDRVAYLASNSAELLIAHFAVPLVGAALVAINTRLSPEEVAYILRHSSVKIFMGESALLAPILAAGDATAEVAQVVVLPEADGSEPALDEAHFASARRYGDLLATGDAEAPARWETEDETATITINYTSGTTGRPKGVMYTHRGAYLNALGEVHHQGFDVDTQYLWSLPMFHCNGWCTTWAVTAAAGTHHCLRAVRGEAMWELIDSVGIDHMCGAPTVLSTLVTAEQAHVLDHPLTIVTAGAPPSPTIIGKIADLGAELVHVYGLTETYGPYSICEPQPAWDRLGAEERSRLMARQGVGFLTAEPLRVVRAESGPDGQLIDVTPDGMEMGEIVMRGNNVMKGYLDDPEGTEKAFAGGWFHSGDLGVMHTDGYVALLDRAKDVVISGGENISTVEVEQALFAHPEVIDVAVIGVPDEKWGERPKAFVVLVEGATVTEADLIAHVKAKIAGYKAPRDVDFLVQLPKTSTGKVRKHELREKEWGDATTRIQG
ncbi:AMP-binding protein [Gordonia jinhuaensis]|uniref:Acyl-CoA synthetase n=1 Tax=Gordonia jinhuaensis TaxID=1517702 RepID=A0A916WW08_9ACTN|nr:AMP-binding protein [Gordonia jinhuaensis]GGB34997.1 acyl-CoA synthetase [Gordonia jinhuaensis]